MAFCCDFAVFLKLFFLLAGNHVAKLTPYLPVPAGSAVYLGSPASPGGRAWVSVGPQPLRPFLAPLSRWSRGACDMPAHAPTRSRVPSCTCSQFRDLGVRWPPAVPSPSGPSCCPFSLPRCTSHCPPENHSGFTGEHARPIIRVKVSGSLRPRRIGRRGDTRR